MGILSFSYEDYSGWKLHEMSLGGMNLLVGHSGAGKTKILRALQTICQSAGKQPKLVSSSWSIKIRIDGNYYSWNAQVESDLGSGHFLAETVLLNDKELLFRQVDGAVSRFKGDALPKLSNSFSVLALLDNEDEISPLLNVFNGIVFVDNFNNNYYIDVPSGSFSSFEELRLTVAENLYNRVYFMNKYFPDEFNLVGSQFIEIFPTVKSIMVMEIFQYWSLNIVEQGVDNVISVRESSSGMYKTLMFLFELHLVPPGSVILLDEIENSLGVNCLDQVVSAAMERAGEVQFVLTSHHPYVINNIPHKYWKLVRRHGSEVTVVDATEIRALNTASSHDRFMQLLNAPEFEEGIS
ncbi:MAG: AAA family ATPase [Magnetococcales bacterium]|nr:AAA family ATPase [Magnetococcales bacterium]MBF0115752.1 AAA family ATPase [Magnetococcales bacterium]